MDISSIGAGYGSSLSGSTGYGSGQPLTEAQQQQVAELAATDRRVRQHEQAHLAAAGGLANSGANFSYRQGPDGKRYAVGGDVSINTSSGRTPQETIDRARRIRDAALAPADPSPQDRRVAAEASRMEAEARAAERQAPLDSSGADRSGSSPSRSTFTASGRLAFDRPPIGSAIDTFA